ncbi:hypothetical protein ACP70R_003829 [Stipagrostis hirtigluma subsp. patula]
MKIAAMHAQTKATLLVVAVAAHALLLLRLSSRRRRRRRPALRLILWGVSAAYFPLMAYVLSYLTTNLWSLASNYQIWLLVSLMLIQFLKDKADMAAMAVAAVTTPAAGDDEINNLKIRPSMESLISSFWVAGLVIYNTFRRKSAELEFVILVISPVWALGACRMVLRFVAFRWATGSFALGRNVQLIDGYIAQLQEAGFFDGDEGHLPPPLIVTGEMKRDVERGPSGYRLRNSALEEKGGSLVTLDRVWSESDPLLVPELKDLCLSFALFKCLRRRLAGCRLAEAGSSWAFRFVRDGLLGREDDHERIFRVIANELTFTSDLYYSPLPVASFGTLSATLHFFISFLIPALLCLLLLLILLLVGLIIFLQVLSNMDSGETDGKYYNLALLPSVLAVVTAWTEISDMVTGVRSNWTKISIIGHYMRCRHRCIRKIFSCLLRRKPQERRKDEIGQIQLLKPSFCCEQPSLQARKSTEAMVSVEVKAAVLSSFRSNGRQLSDGTAAVRRRCQAFLHDVTWACLGGEVATTTDAILVWSIATSLFEIRCSSRRASSSTPATTTAVAGCLSRYCAYLVAEAPELLPDDSDWAKHYYEEVKKDVQAASRRSSAVTEAGVYENLIESFSGEGCHEVLRKGSRLGKQLVEEAERPREEEGDAGAGAGDEDKVWELLAEFWSELLLFLAPSDNVKGHIQALQCGIELITLLWALLLHAGITTRPARHVPEP